MAFAVLGNEIRGDYRRVKMDEWTRKLVDRIGRLTSVWETGEFGRRERRLLPDVFNVAMEIVQAAKLGQRRWLPDVAIVLGSGLGGFEDRLSEQIRIPFSRVGLPQASVEGHRGEIVFGSFAGRNVAVLSGRVHYYEGYDMAKVVTAVRVMAVLGARTAIFSNAAGAINPDFRPGDLMVISDHINLMGVNPLRGENPAGLGPRFPDMTEVYKPQIRALFHKAAQAIGVTLREGVYLAVSGPSYETPAEIRAFKVLGADAVGMSTVPEVIAARHAGLWVGAISCITNMAAGLSGALLSHDEVKEVAARARSTLHEILGWVVGRLPKGGEIAIDA